MGYDRWMLSPISRGEASLDNERARGGGEGGELGKLRESDLKNHMVSVRVLKKAPE